MLYKWCQCFVLSWNSLQNYIFSVSLSIFLLLCPLYPPFTFSLVRNWILKKIWQQGRKLLIFVSDEAYVLKQQNANFRYVSLYDWLKDYVLFFSLFLCILSLGCSESNFQIQNFSISSYFSLNIFTYFIFVCNILVSSQKTPFQTLYSNIYYYIC